MILRQNGQKLTPSLEEEKGLENNSRVFSGEFKILDCKYGGRIPFMAKNILIFSHYTLSPHPHFSFPCIL